MTEHDTNLFSRETKDNTECSLVSYVYYYGSTKFKMETPHSSQYSESKVIPTEISSDIMKHISYRVGQNILPNFSRAL